MKRIILLALFAILAISMTFAAGISEVVPTKRATVDLSTGTSSSDVVSAQFNKDGNLELTYKESSLVEITLTGRLDGTLIVRSDNADYILLLDGVFITGDTLPAIQLKSTTTATIRLVEGSANTISDSPNNTKKGAITSSGDIVFDGSDEGQLDINVYKKHGIKTDGGVTINGGDILIVGDENAEGNMISADMYFVMNGGYLNIYAYGNVHASESKGIKVNGVEGTGAGLGYVEVNGGTINIESVGKGITAGWKISEDATTEDTSDDPIPNVYINGGNVYVYTYGTPYEYSEEESLSPEGIEAKNELFINGGLVALITTDDCLNAGKAVTINGGFVYAFASANDSIDSNGTLAINGGTVICMSSSREQAFDCDKYRGPRFQRRCGHRFCCPVRSGQPDIHRLRNRCLCGRRDLYDCPRCIPGNPARVPCQPGSHFQVKRERGGDDPYRKHRLAGTHRNECGNRFPRRNPGWWIPRWKTRGLQGRFQHGRGNPGSAVLP